MNRYVCLHGHFYQPPRENPWLEVVEGEDSAAPFPDWNQRITSECYAPNAAARILCPRGTIVDILNNYAWISFNFGPTLLSWLETGAPEVYQAILEADRLSRQRLGHGNALAQVYNHIIMPLATPRDRRTQVRWAAADFTRRFGRRPEGMWLAETAVDTDTLLCLAEEGIRFTILAPSQAAAVRPGPEAAWQAVDEASLDPRRAYRVSLPGGRSLAVFFYCAPISRAIAFQRLLDDGAELARRLTALLDPSPSEPQLAHVATDGESYGHHHRFGEMALAYALKALRDDPAVELVNYAAFLERHPPTWEVQVKEDSSWSCPHGVERWRADCGCALDPARGWSQAWRAPLREGLDALNRRLAGLFERLGGEFLSDPWAARDQYVELWPRAQGEQVAAFLARHQRRPLSPPERVQVRKLLECQRWAMYMFTSCGWFFDDIAGLEAVQNLRFAARALQLARELEPRAAAWEAELVERLRRAPCNRPELENGAAVWRRRVVPAVVDLRRVVAHAAIAGVLEDAPLPERLYCYRLQTLRHHHRHGLGLSLAWGEAAVWHRRLGERHRLAYAALHGGGHQFTALVAPAEEARGLDELGRRVERPLRLVEREAILELLHQCVGGRAFTLGELFREGRRQLARRVLEQTLARYRETARSLYQSTRETMAYLHRIDVPLPRVFTALAEAILGEELVRGLGQGGLGPLPPELGGLVVQARELGVRLDSPDLRRALEAALEEAVAGLEESPTAAQRAGQVLDLAEALGVEPDLWRSQNLLYRLLRRGGSLPAGAAELARRLHLDQSRCQADQAPHSP